MVVTAPHNPHCWLAHNGQLEHDDPMPPCEGRLRKVHLIPQQLIKRKGGDPWDERAWVWACGGYSHGNTGHHGMFDYSRKLVVLFSVIPDGTKELAHELGLSAWLEREYDGVKRVHR